MNARKEWKLTQYALGEMEDREKAKFEKHLDAEAREEAEAIRLFTSQLSAELRSEEAPELTAEQKLVLHRKWAEPKPAPKRSFTWKLAWGLSPIAAVFVALLSYRVVQREMSDGMGQVFQGQNKNVDGLLQPAKPAQKIELAEPQREFKKAAPSHRFQDFSGGARAELDVGMAEEEAVSGAPPSASLLGKSRAKRVARGRRQVPADSMTQDDVAFNTESYDRIEDNAFKKTTEEPLSTFSSDVDTASYANFRRFITGGQLPPKDAVRIEEMVNYFPYSYAPPTDSKPFSVHIEVNEAPWNPEHRLVRIGLKGKEIAWDKRVPTNLTFLLDTSGSMDDPNKLPLVKSAMKLIVDKMNADDHIAITVYAGSSGLVLPPTSAKEKEKILNALENLQAGGSTNGGAGIELAYKTAQQMFRKGGNNRVILATDGDFNVGTTNQGDLTRLIEEKAKGGVFLTVLGFGMGNLKDSTMEKLADKGNGNYAYIDSLNEAKKVFVQEIGGTLMTIAKDVKLQVEFNPAKVDSFRLIGYENRVMAHQDFNDDKKDAGDIGAGHTVTALYEIVPFGKGTQGPGVDALKYQKPAAPPANASDELLTLKLRYKAPEASTSELVTYPVKDDGKKLKEATTDYKFASAVAAFGMILRDSPHKGSSNVEMVLDLATGNRGTDPGGYRTEFLGLVEKVKAMKK